MEIKMYFFEQGFVVVATSSKIARILLRPHAKKLKLLGSCQKFDISLSPGVYHLAKP